MINSRCFCRIKSSCWIVMCIAGVMERPGEEGRAERAGNGTAFLVRSRAGDGVAAGNARAALAMSGDGVDDDEAAAEFERGFARKALVEALGRDICGADMAGEM